MSIRGSKLIDWTKGTVENEDKAFYDQSGGGVTLSGGEPLFFWKTDEGHTPRNAHFTGLSAISTL